MENKLTYQQAYDKIIQAYFNDEIKPFKNNFCFCGTLSCGKRWNDKDIDNGIYSFEEYKRMECALFSGSIIGKFSHSEFCLAAHIGSNSYEDFLFKGMSAALEVLKEIH